MLGKIVRSKLADAAIVDYLLFLGILTGFVAACVGIGVALIFGGRAQQPPPPQTFPCPHCQHRLARDAKRCPECGREFTD